jgi:predicted RNA-binding Zn ribbon-like protein
VNLSSYAELAVRLANTAVQADGEPDPLSSTATCEKTFGGRIAAPVSRRDLVVLQYLRAELGAIFTAAAAGNDRAAVSRLNALLIQFPIQPELVSHDDQRWHVHLARQGSASDRLAAGAVIGISLTISLYGVSRLGVCAIASCARVFVDASPNQSRRYCAEHAARGNVSTLRTKPAALASRARTAAS